MSNATQHEHWKRAFNPDWFGAWCLPDGKDVLLTIASVGQELVTGEKGSQEMCLVIRWKENVKPLICNKTNAKVIEKLAKSSYMDAWVGIQVQLYFDPTVRFGKEQTGGIRIRKSITIKPATLTAPPAPTAIKEIICADCGKVIVSAEINGKLYPAESIAASSTRKYGSTLCWDCVQHRDAAAENSTKKEEDAVNDEAL